MLGVEPGVAEVEGLVWPAEGVWTGGVDGIGDAPGVEPVAPVSDEDGEVVLDAPVEDVLPEVSLDELAPAVASGDERTSAPALAAAEAEVLALVPVAATSPDHQSFDIRCFGEAFR